MNLEILEALEIIGKVIRELEITQTPPTTENAEVELLTAGKLAELKWMSFKQLESIYHHGLRKTRA